MVELGQRTALSHGLRSFSALSSLAERPLEALTPLENMQFCKMLLPRRTPARSILHLATSPSPQSPRYRTLRQVLLPIPIHQLLIPEAPEHTTHLCLSKNVLNPASPTSRPARGSLLSFHLGARAIGVHNAQKIAVDEVESRCYITSFADSTRAKGDRTRIRDLWRDPILPTSTKLR